VFFIGEQLLIESDCFLMGINEKGHPKVPFSLMFTYSAGLYDEPDCYGFHKF